MININTIKIGDKVKISGPNKQNDRTLWWKAESMEEYIEKIFTIEKISKKNTTFIANLEMKEDKARKPFIADWCDLIKKGKKSKYIYLCPKCEDEITQEKDSVSPGYFGACSRCDEDLFKEEVIKKLNT